MTTAISTF